MIGSKGGRPPGTGATKTRRREDGSKDEPRRSRGSVMGAARARPAMATPPSGSKPIPAETEQAAAVAVDAAVQVHRELGPGFTESIYQSCLLQELSERGVDVDSEVSFPVEYKGTTGHGTLRLDILVNQCLVLELKSIESVGRVHRKQLLAYLKVTGHRLGLLLNFNVPLMKEGIHRVIR